METTSNPMAAGWPRVRPALTAIALLVIAAIGAASVIATAIAKAAPAAQEEVEIGAVDPQASMTARMLGAAFDHPQWRAGVAGEISEVTATWKDGSIALRLARVIFVAAEGNLAQANAEFEMIVKVASEQGLDEDAGPLLRTVAAMLRAAASGGASTPSPSIETWPAPSRDDLAVATQRLGGFVEFGRAFVEGDAAAKAASQRSGMIVIGVIGAFAIWAAAAILTGLAGGLLLLFMAASGALRNGTGPPVRGSVVLLEVFAVYMVLLSAASVLGEVIAMGLSGTDPSAAATVHFGVVLVAQFGVVAGALGWWRMRGGSWSTLREVAGLGGIRAGGSAIGLGLLGYALAIVIAIGGFMVTALLSWLVGAKNFGAPSHPVHEALAGGGALGVIVIFTMAVVAAPIIEEIFFRGVLYRALRDRVGPGKAALFAGVVGATLISSLYFGLIHPQGILFAPVLAGLGAGFCLVREWSGSVIPGILAHALNNGLMLGLAYLLLS